LHRLDGNTQHLGRLSDCNFVLNIDNYILKKHFISMLILLSPSFHPTVAPIFVPQLREVSSHSCAKFHPTVVPVFIPQQASKSIRCDRHRGFEYQGDDDESSLGKSGGKYGLS
jgi:hypothetical protein